MLKLIVANTHYAFQGMGVVTLANSKSDFQSHSRSLPLATFDKPHANPVSLPLQGMSLSSTISEILLVIFQRGDSVAEWLACWTQAQKGPGSNRSRDAVR